MTQAFIDITTTGDARFIWSDDLVSLRELGPIQIVRASHVEPDAAGNWWADLAPSRGPLLGPFHTRGEAIKAEIAWLGNRDER